MEGQGDVFLLIAVLPGLEWLGHGGGVFIVVEELAQLGRASGGGAWRSGTGRRTRGDVGAVGPRRGSGGTPCPVRGWATARQGGGGPDCHVGAAADEAMETWPLGPACVCVDSAALHALSTPQSTLPDRCKFLYNLVVDFGACKAVIRLLIDCPNPLRATVSAEGTGSNRAETQAPNLVRVLSPGSAPNRNATPLAQLTERSRRTGRKVCVGAARPRCRMCVCLCVSGLPEHVPMTYPRLLPAPAFVDPLWARHGGTAGAPRACIIGRQRHVSRAAVGWAGSGNATPDLPSRGRTDGDARSGVVAHGRLSAGPGGYVARGRR